mmetsp:Transcript_56677/g.132742  ORF Transcript_56677/g.132742 Transcript_56677/m.132742 type:complete len:223 (+) Transcript_56677:108-776(+)
MPLVLRTKALRVEAFVDVRIGSFDVSVLRTKALRVEAFVDVRIGSFDVSTTTNLFPSGTTVGADDAALPVDLWDIVKLARFQPNFDSCTPLRMLEPLLQRDARSCKMSTKSSGQPLMAEIPDLFSSVMRNPRRISSRQTSFFCCKASFACLSSSRIFRRAKNRFFFVLPTSSLWTGTACTAPCRCVFPPLSVQLMISSLSSVPIPSRDLRRAMASAKRPPLQ